MPLRDLLHYLLSHQPALGQRTIRLHPGAHIESSAHKPFRVPTLHTGVELDLRSGTANIGISPMCRYALLPKWLVYWNVNVQ